LGCRARRRTTSAKHTETPNHGATGAVVVTLLGWWSLLLVLNPIVVYGRPPLYTVQNFVWFMAGLQIAELVGRAVEHRGRRTPAANVTPQKA
jgi:hypothetical protein